VIKRFNRFELKYIIRAGTRDALLEDIRAQMVPDPEGGESGVYQVTSLYYDTPDLQFFRSKIDGIRWRRKVRIRLYGHPTDDVSTRAMVEIKQRINRTTQKRRLAVPLDRAYALCGGEPLEGVKDAKDAAVAGEIGYLVRALRLSPKVVISYTRQAFMGGRYEPGLRLTFDHGLWCTEPSALLAPGPHRHAFLPPGWLVMEVKANDAVPLWVARMLARHSCELKRYSKYCAGLAHLSSLERPVETGAIGTG
jgi:hypothetical protein